MRIELDPGQPDAVARAVASLLDAGERPVDPWWAAGLDEALGAAPEPEPAFDAEP